jgi:hypothetical protein
MMAVGLRQALEFEHIQAGGNAVQYGGETVRCLNRRLYAVPGIEGIFRRVARSSSGLNTTREMAYLTTFDGSIIELLRDAAAEAELREAGFMPAANGPWNNYRADPKRADGVAVSEQQGQELREAGLRAVEALDQSNGPRTGQITPAGSGMDNHGFGAPPPPEEDGEGKTAAEILEEQRRQATHEQP